jgi:FkbM family methyltransferase
METTVWDVFLRLARARLPAATLIDCGCAQGYFSAHVAASGAFPGLTFLNIDPNAAYEAQLAEIARVAGGTYAIAAIGDKEGTAKLTLGEDPDWASLRSAKDPYWDTLNGLALDTVEVPVTTLDKLVKSARLPGPYLIKLDLQGAEIDALRGAKSILRETTALAAEIDVAAFGALHALMTEREFDLFDVCEPGRGRSGRLLQFYPVYLHRRHARHFPRNWVSGAEQGDLARSLAARRADVAGRIARDLETVRARGTSPSAPEKA